LACAPTWRRRGERGCCPAPPFCSCLGVWMGFVV
jgi:hypothetical protein